MLSEIKQAQQFASAFIQQWPHYKSEVQDLLQLYIDEVNDGASHYHEYELFVESCKQLLEP